MHELNSSMMDETRPLCKQIGPFRFFMRDGGDASAPLIRSYQLPIIINDCLAVIDLCRRFIDDSTSLPSYTHGEGQPGGSGVTRTASGMSMLMGASNIVLKSVVKNSDDYLRKPLITELYNFNMEWSEDESIKGDMTITVKGSSSLIAKEIKSQQAISILQTSVNDPDRQIVNRPNLWRVVAQSSDLDPDYVVYSDDELKIRAEQQQPDPEQIAKVKALEAQAMEAQSRAQLNMVKIQKTISEINISDADKQVMLAKAQSEIAKDTAMAQKDIAKVGDLNASASEKVAGISQKERQLRLDTVKVISEAKNKEFDNAYKARQEMRGQNG